MSLTSELFLAHAEAIVLARLLHKDRYGYELNRLVLGQSKGKFEFNEATLYSLLQRMEKSGLLLSYWGDAPVAARRKYYTLTPAGRQYYRQRREEWHQARAVIDDLLADQPN